MVKKILIADDNELNARILTDILCLEGYECAVAREEIEALNAFSSSSIGEFSHILIDIQTQVIDGWSVVRRIRNLERSDSSSVVVYVLADSTFKEDLEYARSKGIDSFLSNPIDVEELLMNLDKDAI